MQLHNFAELSWIYGIPSLVDSIIIDSQIVHIHEFDVVLLVRDLHLFVEVAQCPVQAAD